MLLDSKIDITWNNATKRWYESRGYIYTKLKDNFTVNINDLLPTSTIKVNVKCDYCGKIHKKEFRAYLKQREIIDKDSCSNRKCMVNKSKDVNMKLYGVEFSMQRKEISEKVSISSRTSFNDVLFYCKEKGLIVLSNAEDYKNDRSVLKIICEKHIEHGIQENSFANIKSAKHCCKYGAEEFVGDIKRMNFDIVIDKFINCGYTPMFTEDDYKNNESELAYICNKHSNEGVKYTKFIYVNNGNQVCKTCADENRSKSHRFDQDYIFNYFKSRGLIILVNETYINKDKLIKYKCEKHPSAIQSISYNGLKNTECPCIFCRNENSMRKMNRRFRSSISKWKSDTELLCDFRCVITGCKEYDIHHIKPYNEIVKEAMNNLNVSSDETDGIILEELKQEIIKLHEEYGLGVCIHPQLHQLFHSIYGKVTTKENFIEFKNNYINNKIVI